MIDSLRVARIPWFVFALNDVSDSQLVRSTAECPILIINVYDACPKLAPCIVMLADPVPPRFCLLNTLRDGIS